MDFSGIVLQKIPNQIFLALFCRRSTKPDFSGIVL